MTNVRSGFGRRLVVLPDVEDADLFAALVLVAAAGVLAVAGLTRRG
jgi:hypothetical protein